MILSKKRKKIIIDQRPPKPEAVTHIFVPCPLHRSQGRVAKEVCKAKCDLYPCPAWDAR